MIRTRVGYAGGSSSNPTYHDLGDHTEALQIDFDPSRVSYEELLAVFWAGHDPSRRAWSTQYAPILFTHSPAQAAAARLSRDAIAAELDTPIVTELKPFDRFYVAEDYHQKYYLRRTTSLMRELAAYRDDDAGLRDSTAAARLNGWLGRNGTRTDIAAELDQLGLSAAGREEVSALGR